jgi:hypothetical protein
MTALLIIGQLTPINDRRQQASSSRSQSTWLTWFFTVNTLSESV